MVLIQCESVGAVDHGAVGQNPGIHVDAIQMSQGAALSVDIKTWKLSHAVESNLRHALARASKEMPQPAAILLTNQLPCLPSGKFDRCAAKQLPVWNEILSGGVERISTSPEVGTVPSVQQSGEVVALQDIKRAKIEPYTNPIWAGAIPAGGTPASGSEHSGSTCRGMATIPEVLVMKACAEALHGSAIMSYLEPSASLLEMGANSLHVFAIASLLGCSTKLIYQHPAPRSLARALSQQHSPVVARFSRQHHGLGDAVDIQPAIAARSDVDAVMPTETDVPVPDSPATAAAGQTFQHAEQAGLPLEDEDPDRICTPMHRLVWPSQHTGCQHSWPSASVNVLVSDSRGESATMMVKPADLPLFPSHDPVINKSSSPGSGIVAELAACVDAPVALLQCCNPHALQHNPNQGSTQRPVAQNLDGHRQATANSARETCCLELTYTWLIACSHAGDVACTAIFPRDRQGQEAVHSDDETKWKLRFRRMWTAYVQSSPDAGLQVTGCGKAVAVACLSGDIVVLRLRDGENVGMLRTGGQLRRCVLVSCSFHEFICRSSAARE